MSHPFEILRPGSSDATRFNNLCALTVMAKAPMPGKVKTRLTPALTPEEAALLNADFLRDTLASLGAAAKEVAAACVVSYTPAGKEAAFQGILPETTLLLPQRGESFGERLLTTAQDLFALGFAAVCLIDSDSPTVPTSAYVSAVRELLERPLQDRVVLGPSTDGGYYLLGLNRPHARLFAEIAWSTNRVAAQTEERAAELGLPVARLETWFDVDDAESLARLRDEFAREPDGQLSQAYAAPCTRRSLALIDASPDARGVSGSAHPEPLAADVLC